MKIRQLLLRISIITSYNDLRNLTSAVQHFKIQQGYEMLKNGNNNLYAYNLFAKFF